MSPSLILDLVLLGVLLFFFFHGLRRGLIMSLCTLLAVFLAYTGGLYLSHSFSQDLQEHLEPLIMERLAPDEEQTDQADPTEEGSDASDLTTQFSQLLRQPLRQVQQATAEQQSALIAGLAARSTLFLAGFLGVLILWIVLCRALDLVAKLPVLRFLNRTLGGIFGLAQGILILAVVRWVFCDLLGLIPETVSEGSILLSLFAPFSISSLLGRSFPFIPNS